MAVRKGIKNGQKKAVNEKERQTTLNVRLLRT